MAGFTRQTYREFRSNNLNKTNFKVANKVLKSNKVETSQSVKQDQTGWSQQGLESNL